MGLGRIETHSAKPQVTPSSSEALTPAMYLEGKNLEDGWHVVRRLTRSARTTGGCFSCGYLVEHRDGREAYLKALDFAEAMSSPDPALILEPLTKAFNFERQLCKKCASKGLSRIVRIITDGAVKIDYPEPDGVVQYLIFERAEGDIRSKLDASEAFDFALKLRTLHQISTGIMQLHSIGIAHQDLKPSNVLFFSEDGSKVGDLGCSSYQKVESPRDHLSIAGDRGYAPPELLYNDNEPDWRQRRIGCDLYLLGSMVVFFFSRASMTALLMSQLNNDHEPANWGGLYRDVLPYLNEAFSKALEALQTETPVGIRQPIIQVIRDLCNPNPEIRGDPEWLGTVKQRQLHRYVSKFDCLARRAELGLLDG